MTRLDDFDSIGLRGPRLKASETEFIGGSWSVRILNSDTLNPQPAFERAVSGEAIQDHASKVARNDATETQWAEPQNHSVIWPLGANDVTRTTTPSEMHNNVMSIMAVAAWVAGGGQFFPSQGGSLSSVYADYGRMAASSSEGSGVTCSVKSTPGWFVLFYTTGATEEVEGKIVENGRRVDIGWNSNAFSNRGFTYDMVGLPYFSDTGNFSVEMWSSLASGYGVFIGARKIEAPKAFVIGNELARWDITDSQSGDRFPTIDMAIRTFGAMWSLMGGAFYQLPLPTSGYMMDDAIHQDDDNQTAYMHAQWVNQLLY